jgi:hypothetical protein
LVYGRNDNGNCGKDRRCEMNKELLNWMGATIPVTFVLGILGLIFSFGGSFKIQECYSKVNLVSDLWNIPKPIVLNECNSMQFYNTMLFWISMTFVGIAILNLIILYYYKWEKQND